MVSVWVRLHLAGTLANSSQTPCAEFALRSRISLLVRLYGADVVGQVGGGDGDRRGSGDVRRAKHDRRNLVTVRTAPCNRRFPASFNPSLMKEFAISSCTQYLKPMSPLFFFLSKVTASGNKHMNTAITLLKPTAASNQKKIERWYRFLHLLGFILLSDTFLSHLSTCPM